MNNNYLQIQELLHQRADFQARLNLLPYDGNPEIKERDVAFENRSQLEQCRKDVGDEWDDDEIYFVVDELKGEFPELGFKRTSHCSGVLSIPARI